MRITHFVEGLLFAVGFLVLCLVILTGRSSQPEVNRRLAPAPVTVRRPTQ